MALTKVKEKIFTFLKNTWKVKIKKPQLFVRQTIEVCCSGLDGTRTISGNLVILRENRSNGCEIIPFSLQLHKGFDPPGLWLKALLFTSSAFFICSLNII